MRIVIDLQGAQSSGTRTRGIGRYTMSLAHAIVKNRNEHEIFLVLNGLFPDTVEPIRAAFDGLLPQENIRVWNAPGPVAFHDPSNHWRKGAAERIREGFLASLKADIVLTSLMFEGLGDDTVTSVGLFSQTIPTAVILYDLIPYIHRRPYLEDPTIRAWYLEKIEHLCRCDLWLAISEASREDGIEHLGLSSDWTVNVSADADTGFQPLKVSGEEEASVRAQYGLSRPFVMYTGGIDHRKNIDSLIRAFAKLPKTVRQTHQLAIVCSAPPENRQQLEELAEKQGISKEDLIFTGFVPEDHLVALYTLCSLFVFPSWYEGFGLPALEAMRCGAPVIGANTSSLPEVIGWEEAMFDPHSDEEMTKVMERALSDEVFRTALIKNGQKQSVKFSWDESAKRAISAMERLHSTHQKRPLGGNEDMRRPRLAYVSPLPPERSGIADYSAELLPELEKHYEIEVIVAQDEISESWIKKNCPVRSVQWFMEHAGRYDRVLYHFGNSEFHQHMFDMLKAVPGVVVLHDFFLSGIVAHMDFCGVAPGYWAQELYTAHGYKGIHDRFHAADHADVILKYPCSLSVIQDSLGLIVHSSNSRRLAERWFGGESDDWEVIPHLRDSRTSEDKSQARKALGLSTQDFLVCTFGMLGPTKLNHRLLDSWLKSSLARDQSCHLVFVGDNAPGEYGQELLAKLGKAKSKNNISITGWAKKDVFRHYLAAADVGVQLRTSSRGETSGTVLDCMNYGLATIVNANGSMADLDAEAVWKIPDQFTDEQLIEALEALRQDDDLRQKMGKTARDIIVQGHDPRKCAELYYETIERFYHAADTSLTALPDAIADIPGQLPDNTELLKLAEALAQNFPPRNRKRQLMVDVSILVQHDVRTGIQRVVRNVLVEWLHNPPEGYRVEPVYAAPDQPYRYARRFTAKFLGVPDEILRDEPIDYVAGDIFLGLDLYIHGLPLNQSFYQELRRVGVQVKFVVYDLLCILLPHCFFRAAENEFTRWLEVVTENDGAICISESVARELRDWVENNAPERQRPFEIDWFHLGADVDSEPSSRGLPVDARTVLDQIKSRPSFLMVSTIEPRKGHAQVLDAFEQLWRSGVEANLVIVGQQGWMVKSLVKRLRAHSENNNRLFWLEGISDEYLEKLYTTTTCLIAASVGEGFGLPLIEAARHKLPIIARDIPVFREVAGNHAFYFAGENTEDLAKAIKEWLKLYEEGDYPKSSHMPWLTWKESAEQLLQVLIGPFDKKDAETKKAKTSNAAAATQSRNTAKSQRFRNKAPHHNRPLAK